MESNRTVHDGLKVWQDDGCLFLEFGPTRWQRIRLGREMAIWLRDLINAYLHGFRE